MIQAAILYDEYIDRPKLTEHKNTFEYIVPPPQLGRNNEYMLSFLTGIKSFEVVSREQTISFLLLLVRYLPCAAQTFSAEIET